MRDIAVVGGGLGGIVAALTAARRGLSVTIFDQGLPDAGGRLGGFAKFSGAKFSLLPAGKGLIPLAGSEGQLRAATDEVLKLLGIEHKLQSTTTDIADVELGRAGALLRSYESIVLSPTEVDAMVDRLTEELRKAAHIRCEVVSRLERRDSNWQLTTGSAHRLDFGSVLFAGGRTGGRLLLEAGAKPQRGRGLDVGVRIEFLDKLAVAGLRQLGPDAKVLQGRCRTFCLNSPGTIYYYDFDGIRIPGGVVADPQQVSANFGLLCRCLDKTFLLHRVRSHIQEISYSASGGPDVIMGMPFGRQNDLFEKIYGSEVLVELVEFTSRLSAGGLVDWDFPYRVHFPLLDWHWDVFGVENSSRTTLDRVYVIGDSAGHARGLLQAAISGQLAAEEAVSNAAS